MITCETATYLIDKNHYTELSFIEKLNLKIHLYTCKSCSIYKVESNLINDKIIKTLKFDDKEIKLTDEQKERLIKNLK